MAGDPKEIAKSSTRHALGVLEFEKIRSIIVEGCSSKMGSEHAGKLYPLGDTALVRKRLQLISEIADALDSSGQPDLTGISDRRRAIELAVKEAVLEAEELLAIGRIADISNRLVHFRDNACSGRLNLARMLERLEEIPGLGSKISSYILPPGEIKENATPLLTDLRKRKQDVNSRLQARLDKYISSPEYSKYLQDELITLRNGRFVIPVKIENKSDISGVIHDRSASGQTLFIEPLPAVEMNNGLRELELAEKAEKERILRLLTELTAAHSTALLVNMELLGKLDFLVSCARMALRFRCEVPAVGESDNLTLMHARHPLLILESEREEEFEVVPLELDLPGERRALVITGPNMGGKTVALKTVGLLSAMAMSGLPIPADSASHVPHFTGIFADIGDEQSIGDSLSSFAAHVRRWKEAALAAGGDSLVLLDEIGGATDPEEGTPFSQALLEELVGRGAYVLITTHLGGLKALAVSTEGVENGAMEFDEENLEPTYLLRTGAPGRSWAFQIARRLGFPERILERGEELIGEASRIDTLVTDLQKKIKHAERMEDDARDNLRESEERRETLNALIESNREKEHKLEEIRRRYEDDRLDMLEKELSAQRRKLSEELRKIRKMEEAGEEARDLLRGKMKQVEKAKKERRPDAREIKAGERVWLYRLKKHGRVIEGTDENGYILVEVGGMKVRMHSSGAMPPKEEAAEKKKDGGGVRYERPEVPIAKDVRGMTFREAWNQVDHWISDARVVGMPRLTLIHGKGTGALREKFRERLSGDRRIEGWKHAEAREGGEGATIIEMKVGK